MTGSSRPQGPPLQAGFGQLGAAVLLVSVVLGVAAVPAMAQPSAAPGEKTTPHLRVAWHAAPGEIAPGRPTTLVLEVTPAPGMRVYAPGQPDYIPVSLTLGPSPLVTAGAARLPKPVEHVFPPTGERSLVFDRPFRIEVPLSLAEAAPRPNAGPPPVNLSLRGTFEYQACDDAVCYRPVRIPVSWSLAVRT